MKKKYAGLLNQFILFALLMVSCNDQKEREYIVMTVGGEIPAYELGETLSHEHILVDWIGAKESGYHRWDRDSVMLRVLPYLEQIKEAGVAGFVDCSPNYLGRDPILLRNLSVKSGLHIITNTGLYGAVNNRFIPDYVYTETADELAKRWINEFEVGIENTGIKPGFIKIGVREDTLLSDIHHKLVEAAIITHQKTGLVIKSHTGGDIPAFEQINLILEKGISPSAFIWTHAQGGTLESNIKAAELGAWVSLDAVNIGNNENSRGNMEDYIKRLTVFKENDLLNKVLLSHDAGWYDAGEPNGGGFRGYTDIHHLLIPELLNRGFTAEEIQQIMVINPSEAFKIKIRYQISIDR